MHVEVRRACDVREELAAGLRAAQGYGAPSVWGARATENFAPLPKHSVQLLGHLDSSHWNQNAMGGRGLGGAPALLRPRKLLLLFGGIHVRVAVWLAAPARRLESRGDAHSTRTGK